MGIIALAASANLLPALVKPTPSPVLTMRDVPTSFSRDESRRLTVAVDTPHSFAASLNVRAWAMARRILRSFQRIRLQYCNADLQTSG